MKVLSNLGGFWVFKVWPQNLKKSLSYFWQEHGVLCVHQRTCQKVDEDFFKKMWTSHIIQTLISKHLFLKWFMGNWDRSTCDTHYGQIWIKVKSWWQILSQHQSKYLRGPKSVWIEIPSTSKTDHHLLHQKVCQRISVMKTNTGVFVVYKTKRELKCQFSGVTKILGRSFFS